MEQSSARNAPDPSDPGKGGWVESPDPLGGADPRPPQAEIFFSVDEKFDLFGNPVRAGIGKRGRPPFEVTPEKANKIRLGLALGWSNDRIANAVACSPATMKRYFRAELKERAMARDQLDLRRFELVMEQANKGNVGAIKELGKMLERNDSMTASLRISEAQGSMQGAGRSAPKAKPLGKKEAAQIAAEEAGGAGSLWGDDLKPGFERPN